MATKKKQPLKRWKVDLTIVKDVTRIVKARSERQAIAKAKDAVLGTGVRLKRKDFDSGMTQTEREP
jgi:hypothetical protein